MENHDNPNQTKKSLLKDFWNLFSFCGKNDRNKKRIKKTPLKARIINVLGCFGFWISLNEISGLIFLTLAVKSDVKKLTTTNSWFYFRCKDLQTK